MSKFIKIRTKFAFPVVILILIIVLLNRIERYPNKPSLEDILAGRVTIQQDDERLINYIKDVGILRPPPHGRYSLQWPHVRDQSTGQAGYILSHILKNKRNGFFVECGALDGETRSNTLFMERNLGWTGLLVEADPANFKQLLKINRNAWSSNVCLATKPHPHVVSIDREEKQEN
ncbi:hypothetical protein Ocin01_18047 [Orchesella cincta]|uniref:Protein Star n=1 Tax=Orchesella cincta TaxID=48709 RepID=A0A1D2M6N3_ORCCI|nr:hypothetical protein Ocin01_18047 [Orchesella cincta]